MGMAAPHLQRVDATGGEDARHYGLHLAAQTAAKNKDHGEAARLWRRIVEENPGDAYAHLRLAKHCEHKEKDHDAAIRHATLARDLEGDDACEHRLRRLQRKKEKRHGKK